MRARAREIRANARQPAIRHPRLLRTDLRTRWIAVLLTALLAFLWQSFVTQTHVHFDPGIHSTAEFGTAGSAPQLRDGQPSSDLPANCPICQETAHAGYYLLPTPIAFHASEAVPLWLVVARTLALTLRQRAHAWNSRAPPHQLHA